MKGIVLERDKGYIILLTDQADFKRIRNTGNYNIGDEIEISENRIAFSYARFAAAAACFLLFFLFCGGIFLYNLPYNYISIDINPSIEIVTNRFEKVIQYRSLNEDGNKVIYEAGNIKGHKLDEAVQAIIKTAKKQGYLKENAQNAVMIVASNKNESSAEKVLKKVEEVSVKELIKISKEYQVVAEKVSLVTHKQALEKDISPGKAILAKKVKEKRKDIAESQVKELSVSEALKIIKEQSGEFKELKDGDSKSIMSKSDADNTESVPQSAETAETDKSRKDKIDNNKSGSDNKYRFENNKSDKKTSDKDKLKDDEGDKQRKSDEVRGLKTKDHNFKANEPKASDENQEKEDWNAKGDNKSKNSNKFNLNGGKKYSPKSRNKEENKGQKYNIKVNNEKSKGREKNK